MDDDDEVVIDQEWKSLNEKRFNDLVAGKEYRELTSQSGNGKILWKNSQEIETIDERNLLRIAVDGKPEFTDTVVVRYEGWYFNKNNEKLIFDSTENPSLRTEIDYSLGLAPNKDPNKISAKFAVNPSTVASASNGYIGGVIDGWSTALQDMVLGEEREIVLPYQLAYGSTPSTYRPSSSGTIYTLIPAYTTLHFRLKLLKIIPMKGRS